MWNRSVHGKWLKNPYLLFKLNFKQCCSSSTIWGRLFRQCFKAKTSQFYPAVCTAAAGKSNYRLGSPLGITESVSRRPACKWQLSALGTREPKCVQNKNKVSCPAYVGFRHLWKSLYLVLVIVNWWSITVIVLAQKTLWERELVHSFCSSELCVWNIWPFIACLFKDGLGNKRYIPIIGNIRILWVQLCPVCTNGF